MGLLHITSEMFCRFLLQLGVFEVVYSVAE